MNYCSHNCQICKNLVFSTSTTVVTVDGTDTLVIDIPSATYNNHQNVCLVITQNIPTTATIAMPVAISIGGDTTTVYPLVGCNCVQLTACSIRTRKKYPTIVLTNTTSAVFKTLNNIVNNPCNNLPSIPVTTAAGAGTFALRNAGTVKETKTVTTTIKKEVKENE